MTPAEHKLADAMVSLIAEFLPNKQIILVMSDASPIGTPKGAVDAVTVSNIERRSLIPAILRAAAVGFESDEDVPMIPVKEKD